MLTRSALLFAFAAVPAILGLPNIFADMRQLAETLGMPPAEWHWWNYSMVGGGLFVMALSAYGMALGGYRIYTRRSKLQKQVHSVDAESANHRWAVSRPTVTVTRASFWTRTQQLFRQLPFPTGTTDEEAVRRNPGNGRRMIRLIMNASTVDEVEDRYSDFASAPHRTREIDVFAACAVKTIRLLNGDDEAEKNMWWEFSSAATKEFGLNEPADEFFAAAERLDKEYPAIQPMAEPQRHD